MAAYHKVEVSLNTNAVEVGIPSPQTVNVVVPTIGPAGPAGATGATGAVGAVGPQGPAGTGIETLTTAGDLLYQTSEGADRLPIGTEGQVLAVTNGSPAWEDSEGGNPFDQELNTTDEVQFAKVNSVLTNGDFDNLTITNGQNAILAINNPSAAAFALFTYDASDPDDPQQIGQSLLGVRGTDAFLQGTSSDFRMEKSGGDLADINVANVKLKDGVNDFIATIDAQDALSGGVTLTIPDQSGTLAVVTDIPTEVTDLSATGISVDYVPVAQGDGTIAWEAQSGGGGGDTVSIQTTAADILSVSSGAISADDAGADRIVYWNNTSNKLTYGTPSDVGAAASSHTHSDATQSVAGFLSTADKTKLDGIASGAEVNVNADWNASSGDAQILNKPTLGTAAAAATTDFAAASHTHAASAITSGTLDVARLPVGTGSTQVAAGNHTHVVADVTGAAASGSITTSGLTQATARILGRTSSSTGSIEEIQIGSGLSLSAGELSATGGSGIGGGTGSTDNSILRSDGTGGSTLQDSGLVIDDEVVAFNITGVASTDIITAVGHNFTNNQLVRFPTLTGGSGLFSPNNFYFVRDIVGDTFKVSSTSGGAALNFTTDITAGTIVGPQPYVSVRNVSTSADSSTILGVKGTGSFIVSPAVPDGGTSGGNARGNNSVCIVPERNAASQVASGLQSVAIGQRATASGSGSVAIGSSAIAGTGGSSVAIGATAQATGISAVAIGLAPTASLRAMFSTTTFSSIFWGGTTTNATATVLNLDAAATNRFTIAANTALAVDILLVARRSDTADKWLVARRFLGIRRGGSNNTSLIGSVQTLGVDQSDGSPSWTFALTADDTNEALQLEVQGAASETIQWRATAFYRVV
jgi:hypothetical protein